MSEKGIVTTILCCLVILLTVLNLGLYAANRIIVRSHRQQLAQIQQQITNRDRQVQQFIGQLKASKTIEGVKEVLEGIK